MQIYFDFSGYCDMAIGLALSFGIRLPVNFRSPYQALSIVEFWRCWHITVYVFYATISTFRSEGTGLVTDDVIRIRS